MVEVNRRHHRRSRRYDVRSVEPPAHANLEHCHLDFRLTKQREGDGRRRLEECRRRVELTRLGELMDRRSEGRRLTSQICRRDRTTVDREALFQINQMRGGEATGGQAATPQGGFDHRGDGSLAVRPGDDD